MYICMYGFDLRQSRIFRWIFASSGIWGKGVVGLCPVRQSISVRVWIVRYECGWEWMGKEGFRAAGLGRYVFAVRG